MMGKDCPLWDESHSSVGSRPLAGMNAIFVDSTFDLAQQMISNMAINAD
jgi:hypothetical protein